MSDFMIPRGKIELSQIKIFLNEATKRHSAGELAVAEVLYRKILDADPKNFDALHMLAVVGHQAGQTDEALKLFESALRIRSKDTALLVNYGAALRKGLQFEKAIAIYDRALALNANLQEALFNKAQSLADLLRFDEAAECCRRCLAVKPNDPDTLVALGNALKNSRQADAAISCFEEALAIDPKNLLAFVSMGETFRNRGWTAASLEIYEKALRLDPRNVTAKFHRSIALLKLGRIEEGWKDYDGRFWYSLDGNATRRRQVPPMYWDGEDLSGKSILVWTEQGLGDEIIYGGMIPELIAKAGRVVIECAPRMVPVFKRSFPAADVFGWQHAGTITIPPNSVDYQISIASLGQFLRTKFSDFPCHSGYLKPDPRKVKEFKLRYGNEPLIGISWRSARAQVQKYKSTTLEDWIEILKTPGVRFVNLQYGDHAAEIDAFREAHGIDIINDPTVDALQDMDTFYAQVAALDLVISVSNTTIHVAGSLGKPAWLLLPSSGNGLLWYWFLKGEQSPWYPSLKIFRQTADMAIAPHWWIEVTKRAAAEFRQWVHKFGAQ